MSIYPDDKQHGSNNNDTDNDDIYRQSIKHVSSGAMPLRSITASEATIATKWLETVAYSAGCGKLSFSVELGS
jgi:hypothetical protein